MLLNVVIIFRFPFILLFQGAFASGSGPLKVTVFVAVLIDNEVRSHSFLFPSFYSYKQNFRLVFTLDFFLYFFFFLLDVFHVNEYTTFFCFPYVSLSMFNVLLHSCSVFLVFIFSPPSMPVFSSPCFYAYNSCTPPPPPRCSLYHTSMFLLFCLPWHGRASLIGGEGRAQGVSSDERFCGTL